MNYNNQGTQLRFGAHAKRKEKRKKEGRGYAALTYVNSTSKTTLAPAIGVDIGTISNSTRQLSDDPIVNVEVVLPETFKSSTDVCTDALLNTTSLNSVKLPKAPVVLLTILVTLRVKS